MSDKTSVIRLQFVLGLDFVSWLISWFSAGHFSHVDIVVPKGHGRWEEGSLVGARSDVIKGIPAGVQNRPANYERWRRRVVFSIPCTPEQEAAFWLFVGQQIDKGYDMTAIFAFVVNRNWRDIKKWFCSELAAAALELAKIIGAIYSGYNKIAPVMLANMVGIEEGVTFEEMPIVIQ